MPEVFNPIAPAAPTFDPPSSNHEISQEARDFALSPMADGPSSSRAPTDAEQVQRLSQARDILGDRFWQEKQSAPPSVAEQREASRLATLGVKPGAQPHEYIVQLPQGAPETASERIRSTLSALELSKPLGDYIGQRVIETGQRVSRLSEADQTAWRIEQERIVTDWAISRGWNLEAKRADVAKLLEGKDSAVATIMMGDADTFIRLVNHADNLKSVKR